MHIVFKKSVAILSIALLNVVGTAQAYQADIEYVSARDYFKAALQEINQAKESIDLFMFVVSYKPGQPNSKPGQLLKALIDAKERGVKVSAYFDQNVDFYDGGDEIEGKNNNAAEYLKKNGVDVYLDNKYTYSHSKALVIDGKITLIGSSNWSRSAFTRNNEANILVQSEKYATEILEDLVPKQQIEAVKEKTDTITIPRYFVFNKNLMGQMVTQQDERAFDIYLWLLMKVGEAGSKELTVNYKELADSLGIGSMTREDYRRQITKVLRKLEDEYELIELGTDYDAPANVKLTDLEDAPSGQGVKVGAIELPKAYWDFGWNQKLTMPGKVMLLLNWFYSVESDRSPTWHVSSKDLIERHGIGETFIGDGIMELRKLNLIDVRYKEIPGSNETPKQYGVYSPNEIYDSVELESRFKELAATEGKEQVQRARSYAQAVFKQNDYEDVLTLIGLEKQYGQEVIEEAVRILRNKRKTNPKKHMGYLVGTIRGIGEKD